MAKWAIVAQRMLQLEVLSTTRARRKAMQQISTGFFRQRALKITGPDEAPRNTKTLTVWANQFKQMNLDACFIFTRAPGSSAYNPVERRMAPLSKMTASVILPFDTFSSHLIAANKTTDIEL